MASVDFTHVALLAEVLLATTIVLFALCSLDDLVVDAYYALRQAYVGLVVRRRHPALRAEHLAGVPEQPIAILLTTEPGTRPVDLDRMLRHTVTSVDYTQFRVFVAADRGDRTLESGLEALQRTYRVIEPVVVDRAASRPERLNALLEHARRSERKSGVPFQIFVVQEAGDVVHPLALRLFNYLMPRFAMIQTPVLALPVAETDLVAGARLDELATVTAKEMVVRERLGRNVPSAGAGTAFTRHAADAIAEAGDGRVFRTDVLAEDYDFGFRLSALGLKSIFARVPAGSSDERLDWIATRRSVPSSFTDAVREKSRWILGTALQGWERLGWCGTWRTRYVLFRDRKVLLKAQLSLLADVTVLVLAALFAWSVVRGRSGSVLPHVPALDGWLGWLALASFFVIAIRAVSRAAAVGRLYGRSHALWSVPRAVVLHVILFVASWRAILEYAGARLRGEPLERERPAAGFPTAEELGDERERLAACLVERLFLTTDDLETALGVQRRTGQPLGSVLVELGLAAEDDVLQILGERLRLSVRSVDPYAVPTSVLTRLPKNVALSLGVFPIAEKGGVLEVATDRLVSREDVDLIEHAAGGPVEVVLASRRDVAFALRRRYRKDSPDVKSRPPLLGESLVTAGVLKPDELSTALRIQREGFRRVGDVVVEEGWVDRERVEEAAAAARAHAIPIGQELRRRGWITEEQLDESLRRQAETDRRLGDILVEQGFVTRDDIDDVLVSSMRSTAA